MSKKSCMGTVLEQKISGTYTAVAQVLSISRSGCGDETFDGTCLDSAADNNSVIWKEKIQSGAAEPGKVTFELFLDPTLSGHQTIVGSVGQGNQDWKIIYPNSGGAADLFTSASIQYGVDIKVGDGLKMSVDLDLTGPVTSFGS